MLSRYFEQITAGYRRIASRAQRVLSQLHWPVFESVLRANPIGLSEWPWRQGLPGTSRCISLTALTPYTKVSAGPGGVRRGLQESEGEKGDGELLEKRRGTKTTLYLPVSVHIQLQINTLLIPSSCWIHPTSTPQYPPVS
jgi:hypothetical protein